MNREEIISAYQSGISISELSRLTGFAYAMLKVLLVSWGVSIRSRSEAIRVRRLLHPEDCVPDIEVTPEEIAQRKAEIQASWTVEQELARRASGRRIEFEFPRMTVPKPRKSV